MNPHIAFAVFATLFLAGASAGGALAACPADHAETHPSKTVKQHTQAGNCVDLGVVPQISANIAASGQKAAAKTKTSDYEPAQASKYEGPTIGLTKPEPGVRPAPTVGYKWSLE